MKKILIAGLVIALVFVVVGVIAEDKIPLEVRIKSMKGDVDIRLPGGIEWKRASQGMVIKEGTQISTGYGAEAELQLADSSIVNVYQLTQIGIDKFFRERAKVKTNINLKIGRVKAKVQRIEDELSDFDVVTPTSVVSARGTVTKVGETDFGTDASAEKHTIEVRDNKGRREVVRQGQVSKVKPGEVPTQVVVERLKAAKVNVAVIGESRSETKRREIGDMIQVKPGVQKSGSVS